MDSFSSTKRDSENVSEVGGGARANVFRQTAREQSYGGRESNDGHTGVITETFSSVLETQILY